MIPDRVAAVTTAGHEVALHRSLIVPRRRWWQWAPFAKMEWAWCFGAYAQFRMLKVTEGETQRWIDMGRVVSAVAGDHILAHEIERPDEHLGA